MTSAIFFFFNDTATTEIYTLSLHDALPISTSSTRRHSTALLPRRPSSVEQNTRSEEHTSELQSRLHLVCRLLLEKKKTREQFSGYIRTIAAIINVIRTFRAYHYNTDLVYAH